MVFTDFIYRYSEMIAAPFENPNILWFGIPLLATLIVTELNISSKKQHELKHSLPVALVLLFVGIDLLRLVFTRHPSLNSVMTRDFAISCFVVLLAVVIFLLDWFSLFPKKAVLKMSAYLPVNVVAYSCMVLVYNKIELDWLTALSAVVFMAVIWGLVALVSIIAPWRELGKMSKRVESEESKGHKKNKGKIVDI